MPILALFSRSLRQDSRRLSTYLIRLLLCVTVLVSLAILVQQRSLIGAPGLTFFSTVVYINFVFISLAGIGYFPSVITEEKEEMTLGLVRMTDLSPLSILLGKSTSRMITVIMLLFTQFPFTLLAVTLGGISINQIFAAYLTLLAYIILLSNLALLFSVLCKRSSSSAALTLGMLLGFLLLPVIGTSVLKGIAQAGWVPRSAASYRFCQELFAVIRQASPLSRIKAIMSTGFSQFPIGFQVLTNAGAGAVFLLLSWAGFDLFTRRQTEVTPTRSLTVRRTSRLRLLGGGRVWSRALMWKDFHFMTGGRMGMLIRFVLFAMVIGLVAYLMGPYQKQEVPARELGRATMSIMLGLLLVELAFYAAGVFNREMRWRTLSSVYVLPISVAGLAYRKLAGCMLGLIPELVYFGFGILLAPRSFADGVVQVLSEPDGWWLIASLVFFIHLTAYLSLVVKRGALAIAFGIAFVGNWLGFVALFTIPFISPFEDIPEWLSFPPILVVLVLLSILLHRKVGSRLAKVAAQ